MSIWRQADQYPRDDKKVVYTPEEEALIAEITDRLHRKVESGELPPLDAASPEHLTHALQEVILMHKEQNGKTASRNKELIYEHPHRWTLVQEQDILGRINYGVMYYGPNNKAVGTWGFRSPKEAESWAHKDHDSVKNSGLNARAPWDESDEEEY